MAIIKNTRWFYTADLAGWDPLDVTGAEKITLQFLFPDGVPDSWQFAIRASLVDETALNGQPVLNLTDANAAVSAFHTLDTHLFSTIAGRIFATSLGGNPVTTRVAVLAR